MLFLSKESSLLTHPSLKMFDGDLHAGNFEASHSGIERKREDNTRRHKALKKKN